MSFKPYNPYTNTSQADDTYRQPSNPRELRESMATEVFSPMRRAYTPPNLAPTEIKGISSMDYAETAGKRAIADKFNQIASDEKLTPITTPIKYGRDYAVEQSARTETPRGLRDSLFMMQRTALEPTKGLTSFAGDLVTGTAELNVKGAKVVTQLFDKITGFNTTPAVQAVDDKIDEIQLMYRDKLKADKEVPFSEIGNFAGKLLLPYGGAEALAYKLLPAGIKASPIIAHAIAGATSDLTLTTATFPARDKKDQTTKAYITDVLLGLGSEGVAAVLGKLTKAGVEGLPAAIKNTKRDVERVVDAVMETKKPGFTKVPFAGGEDFVLPNRLKKISPKYKPYGADEYIDMSFGSDIDRALYSVGKPAGKPRAKSFDDMYAFLREAYPDKELADFREMRVALLEKVKDADSLVLDTVSGVEHIKLDNMYGIKKPKITPKAVIPEVKLKEEAVAFTQEQKPKMKQVFENLQGARGTEAQTDAVKLIEDAVKKSSPIKRMELATEMTTATDEVLKETIDNGSLVEQFLARTELSNRALLKKDYELAASYIEDIGVESEAMGQAIESIKELYKNSPIFRVKRAEKDLALITMPGEAVKKMSAKQRQDLLSALIEEMRINKEITALEAKGFKGKRLTALQSRLARAKEEVRKNDELQAFFDNLKSTAPDKPAWKIQGFWENLRTGAKYVFTKSTERIGDMYDKVGATLMGEMLAEGTHQQAKKLDAAQGALKKIAKVPTDVNKKALLSWFTEKKLTKGGVEYAQLDDATKRAYNMIDRFMTKLKDMQTEAGEKAASYANKMKGFRHVPHRLKGGKKFVSQSGEYAQGVLPGWFKHQEGIVPSEALQLDPTKFLQTELENTIHYSVMEATYEQQLKIVSDKRWADIYGEQAQREMKKELHSLISKDSHPALKALDKIGAITRAVILMGPGSMKTVVKQGASVVDELSKNPTMFAYMKKVAPDERLLKGTTQGSLDFTDVGQIGDRIITAGLTHIGVADNAIRRKIYRANYWQQYGRLISEGLGKAEAKKLAIRKAWKTTEDLMSSSAKHQSPRLFRHAGAKGLTKFLTPANAAYQERLKVLRKGGKGKAQFAAGTIGNMLFMLAAGGALTLKEWKTLFTPSEWDSAEGKELLSMAGRELAETVTPLSIGSNVLEGAASGTEEFGKAKEQWKKDKDSMGAEYAVKNYLKGGAGHFYNAEGVFNSLTKDYIVINGKQHTMSGWDRARQAYGSDSSLPITRQTRAIRKYGKSKGQDVEQMIEIINNLGASPEEFMEKQKGLFDITGVDSKQRLATKVEKLFGLPSSIDNAPTAFLDGIERMTEEQKANYFSLLSEDKYNTGIELLAINEEHPDELRQKLKEAVSERDDTETKKQADLDKYGSAKAAYEAKQGISQPDTGVKKEKRIDSSTRNIVPFKRNPNRLECGETTNDWLGLTGDERMGDTYASKTDGKTFKFKKDGGEPIVGGYFVQKGGTKLADGTMSGHSGLVTGKNKDGIFIADSNKKGKKRLRETFLPYDSDEYKTITGFGGKRTWIAKMLIKKAEEKFGRKLNPKERKRLLRVRGVD